VTTPTTAPITMAKLTVSTDTNTLVAAPAMIRLSTSRPNSSVPSQ
jgi:hypothetical protein